MRCWLGFLSIAALLVVSFSPADAAQTPAEIILGSRKLTQKDLPKLRQRAESGDRLAEFQMGLAYQIAEGIPRDDHQAAEWFQRAAEHGLAEAQTRLGIMYYSGEGVAQDRNAAAYWFTAAAMQGNPVAQINLGFLYDRGYGTSKDSAKALYWYHAAAERGYAEAQYRLGTLYDRGVGVARDGSIACRWYKKAADQGHPRARVDLENSCEQQPPDAVSSPRRSNIGESSGREGNRVALGTSVPRKLPRR